MASTIVKRLILLASLVVSFAFASQASAQRVILVDESNEATPQVEARAALGLLGISTDAANLTYAATGGDFVTGYGPLGETRNRWDLMIVELHRTPITSVTAGVILDHLAAGRPLIFSAPSLYQPSSNSLFAVSQSLQTAMGLNCTASLTAGQAVTTAPSNGVDLFNYPDTANRIVSPMTGVRAGTTVFGNICNFPTGAPAGGRIFARLGASAVAGNPAILFTANKKVLWHALVGNAMALYDNDADGVTDLTEYYRNAIQFILDEQVGRVVTVGDTDFAAATAYATSLGVTATTVTDFDRLDYIINRGNFDTLFIEYRDLTAAPDRLENAIINARAKGKQVLFFSSDFDGAPQWATRLGFAVEAGDHAGASVVRGTSGLERRLFQQPNFVDSTALTGTERADGNDVVSTIPDGLVSLGQFEGGGTSLLGSLSGDLVVGAFIASEYGQADTDGNGKQEMVALLENAVDFAKNAGPVALLISDDFRTGSPLEAAAAKAGYLPVREIEADAVLDVFSTLDPAVVLLEVEGPDSAALASASVLQAVSDWLALDQPVVAAGGKLSGSSSWAALLGIAEDTNLTSATGIKKDATHLGRIFNKGGVPSPLTATAITTNLGSTLFLTRVGSAVARYSAGTLLDGVATVSTYNGRAIVNGFSPTIAGATDTDTDGTAEMVELLAAQIAAAVAPEFALIFDDETSTPSILAEAAQRAGLRSEVVTDGSGFEAAFDAGGQQQIAIDIHATDAFAEPGVQSRLLAWVGDSKGLIVNYSNLDEHPEIALAFGITAEGNPAEVVDHLDATPAQLFEGISKPSTDIIQLYSSPVTVRSPLTFGTALYADAGDELPTIGSAVVTGRFARVTGAKAALALQGGRILWNGFAPRQLAYADDNGDDIPEIVGYFINSFVRVGRVPVAATTGPYTMNEGSTLSVSASPSFDPSGETLTYGWDFNNDGIFTDATTATASLVGTAFDGPSEKTIAVRITNTSGLTATASVQVTVVNVAPTVSAGADRIVDQGVAATGTATTTDLAADTVTVTWDFGDGSPTATGATFSHTYAALGNYIVTATAADEDGGSSNATFQVNYRNLAPLPVIAATTSAAEGSLVTLTATATDPGGDSFEVEWDFGDGSPTATGLSVTHIYADDNTYTIRAIGRDSYNDTRTATTTQRITNVAPIVSSAPVTTAVENEPYSYQVTVTDPGSADTQTYTLVSGPAGMTISPTGLISWTAPAGVYTDASVSIRVTDSDGGFGTQAWDITVTIPDRDSGGAPDSCEARFGFDVNDPADDTADPDNDGLTTAQECYGLTDPTFFSGPPAPTAVEPIDGAAWEERIVRLKFSNVDDPDGVALTYECELYSEIELTTQIWQQEGVEEDANRDTSICSVDAELTDDTTYCWRVRGVTSDVDGTWSEPACFFYNLSNSVPTTPRGVAPVGTISTQSPLFEIENASDPEGRPLSYAFALYRGTLPAAENLLFETLAPSGEGSGTTIDTGLTLDNRENYIWRVRAFDGSDYGQFDSRTFRVEATSAAPSVPVIVSPTTGSSPPATSQANLVWQASTDPDGDALTYEGEFVTGTFPGSDAYNFRGVSGAGATVSVVVPRPLVPGATYSWRVRATDGGATSTFAEATFTIRGANTAPTTPVPIYPVRRSAGDRDIVVSPDATFTLTAQNAIDPDADQLITYDFQVSPVLTITDQGGWKRLNVRQGADGTTSVLFDEDLRRSTYYWRVRASDGVAQSAWSATAVFDLELEDADAGDADVGTDGGITDAGADASAPNLGGSLQPASGCSAAGSGFSLWMLAPLLLLVTRRRRSR
jgi:PKD repeat protein